MFCVYHACLSVHCSLLVTCWESANLLALLYVMLDCVFVTFPCVVLSQVWCLFVLIPDLCLLTYLYAAISCSVISDFAGPEVVMIIYLLLQTQI